MHNGYRTNEEDIQTIIRYLEIHDPANADRDYAIQLIEPIQEFGREVEPPNQAQAEATSYLPAQATTIP